MALNNLFAELATEATLKLMQRGFLDYERRFEWQDVSSENKPLYIGVAPQGALSSDNTWEISKFTWVAGPVTGTTVVERIQTANGSWDNRATLFP
jgi:hypothetical protein